MQKKIYKKFYCPVPEEQRPLNEYLNLKNVPFFDWPTFDLKKYIFKLSIFAFIILFFSIPISNYCSYYFEFQSRFFLLNLFTVGTSEIFLLLRVYLGWSYIEERLTKPFVEYEESGWYDGQIWIKPIKILKQDRLICYYKVLPILSRLKKTILYCLIIYFIIFIFSLFN
jgi:hypothetical protein